MAVSVPGRNVTHMISFQLPRKLQLLGLLLGLATPVTAATNYIDFVGGNDNNSGDSPAAAWKTLPGTRTLDGLNWQTLDYGQGKVNKNLPIKPGTVLAIKRGTTHTSANGGFIWINDYFYAGGATSRNPISIVAADAWGYGSVTFDGLLIPATVSLIIIQQDGIRMDGRGADGICVKNSAQGGLMIKEKAGGGASVDQCALVQMRFFNNGWSFLTDFAGAGSGQVNVRRANGLRIDKLNLDGNSNYINGVLLGDNHRSVINALVVNSKAYNHKGDPVSNDAGIGFKALNSQVEYRGDISRNNLKGWDLGEQQGDNVDITYKIINSTACNNTWGANMNCAATAIYTGAVNFYVINSLLYANTAHGMNVYSGPFNLHVVHSVFANNGDPTSTYKASGHLRVTPDTLRDDGAIRAYLYNNIFYKAAHTALTTSYFNSGTNFVSVDSDYNAFVQGGTELFCRWAYYNSGQARDFAFGVNGMGNPLGEWARFYGDDTVQPASAMTGHFGCDTHSKGTGAEDPTLPMFVDVAHYNFRLQVHYPGASLEAQPWFIPEMGYDTMGIKRVAWDMGAFEVTP